MLKQVQTMLKAKLDGFVILYVETNPNNVKSEIGWFCDVLAILENSCWLKCLLACNTQDEGCRDEKGMAHQME